ncbi:hypothetical protein K439DRAFT_803779 [Ramaria rubella]|nr:hypothetical protein K439DRAFT_803779 [Ramaria rubella]
MVVPVRLFTGSTHPYHTRPLIMGGEGPATQFNQDATIHRKHCQNIGLTYDANADNLEALYERAKPFFLAKKKELLELPEQVNGYMRFLRVEDVDVNRDNANTKTSNKGDEQEQSDHLKGPDIGFNETLLHLKSWWRHESSSIEHEETLCLPRKISSFILPSSAPHAGADPQPKGWERMFTYGCSVDAKRDNRDNRTLHIASPAPFADIFYLLQLLLPGMLVIYRVDEIDDSGEYKTVKILPPIAWIEKNEDALKSIFVAGDRWQELRAAAEKGANHEECICSYNNHYDSDESVKDFTACDKECGYCGRCDY